MQQTNLIGRPSLQKNETVEAPITKASIFKYRVPPLCPTYKGERRTTLNKSEVVWRTFWGIFLEFGEHIGSLMELIGNLKGTHWEAGKNEQKIIPPAPQI